MSLVSNRTVFHRLMNSCQNKLLDRFLFSPNQIQGWVKEAETRLTQTEYTLSINNTRTNYFYYKPILQCLISSKYEYTLLAFKLSLINRHNQTNIFHQVNFQKTRRDLCSIFSPEYNQAKSTRSYKNIRLWPHQQVSTFYPKFKRARSEISTMSEGSLSKKCNGY